MASKKKKDAPETSPEQEAPTDGTLTPAPGKTLEDVGAQPSPDDRSAVDAEVVESPPLVAAAVKAAVLRALRHDVPRRTLAGGIAFFLAGAALAGGTAVWQVRHDAPSAAAGPAIATAAPAQMSTPRLANSAEVTGVVQVIATSAYTGQVSTGTGVILSAGGTIVTAHSLLLGATSVQVLIPGRGPLTATVVGSDMARNITVLSVQPDQPLTPVALADSAVRAVAGTTASAVGTAGGAGQLLTASGRVNANSATLAHGFSGVEVTAAASPGFAGGPIFDATGQVVAVAIDASSDGATTHVLGLDAPEVLAAVGRVMAGQTSPAVVVGASAFLGVTFQDPATSAVVYSVLDGTAAVGAGLAAGDQILSFDGSPVTSGQQLASLVVAHKPGDDVTVTWSADGGPMSVTITLGAGPVS